MYYTACYIKIKETKLTYLDHDDMTHIFCVLNEMDEDQISTEPGIDLLWQSQKKQTSLMNTKLWHLS